MLLWLNGMTNPAVQHPIETMMDEFTAKKETSILPLLADDEFFVQAKNLNFRVMEFLKKQQHPITLQYLELITQKIESVDENNFDNVAVFPLLAVEFFELDLPPLTEVLLTQQYLKILFEPINLKDDIPEPQWAFILRMFNFLITKNSSIVCEHLLQKDSATNLSYLHKFLNHLASATVNNMLIQIYNSDNYPGKDFSEIKLEVIKLGFQGIELMDEMSVLNFAYLIHEIMTKYFNQDQSQIIIDYIVKSQVLTQMFEQLIKHQDNLFLCKSSAHIISLISNYYSYSMQNILLDNNSANPETDIAYHQQLTQQFEQSEFMAQLSQKLIYFQQQFTQKERKLGTLKLKLLEIIDNLIRISNLKLWDQLQQLNILQLIIDHYFENPQSDIFHSLFEKLLLYIFNRAISDFHPYWTQQLIQNIKIYNIIALMIKSEMITINGYIYLIANHLNWFQRELSEKLTIDGPTAPYYTVLKQLEETILLDDDWRKAQEVLYKFNQTNRLQLGTLDSSINQPQDSNISNSETQANPQQTIFSKVKSAVHQQFQPIQDIQGDVPADYGSPEQGDFPQEQIKNVSITNPEFKDQQQEEVEYDYEQAQSQRKSPKKVEENQQTKKEQLSPEKETYTFIQNVFIQSPHKQDSGKKIEYNESIQIEELTVKDTNNQEEEQQKSQIQLVSQTLQQAQDQPSQPTQKTDDVKISSPNKIGAIESPFKPIKAPEIDIPNPMMDDMQQTNNNASISLQEFVVPLFLSKSSEKNKSDNKGIEESQKSITLQEFVVPISQHIESASPQRKLSEEQELRDKMSTSARLPTVEQIIKKYSLSHSTNLGQAKQEVQPYKFDLENFNNKQNFAITRKQSMESSLRLKQLEGESFDEFKIIKQKDDEQKLLIQPNDQRVLVVDELDIMKPQKDSLNSSLVNSTLSNSSFDSKGYRKMKIKWKSSPKIQVDVEEPLQVETENMVQSQSNYIPILSMRDSIVSNQSGMSYFSNGEKKFRKVSQKDQNFLNYIKGIK